MTEDALPYGHTPDTSFESQYRRVLEAAACRTQARLAEVLEIRQSSISDARRRKTVPSEWLATLFEKKGVNPDWIRTGTGAKCLKAAGAKDIMPHPLKAAEVRPVSDCSAQDLINELVRRAMLLLDVQAAKD